MKTNLNFVSGKGKRGGFTLVELLVVIAIISILTAIVTANFTQAKARSRDAKRICAQCTVKSECLEYALKNDERFGIWGGLSERERRRLRKRA